MNDQQILSRALWFKADNQILSISIKDKWNDWLDG